MSATTTIEWTDRSWNPTRGCSIVSPGCVNCYAMKQAHRFSGEGKAYHGLTKQTKAGPQWTGNVITVESALLEPLSWRKPQRVFVNSMSDLFHEDVEAAFIDRVFAVMALAPQHTFQILTKRAERMHAYVTGLGKSFPRLQAACPEGWTLKWSEIPLVGWPLPNVWLGTSVENQQYADARIPLLLQTPAAVRFISAEPLLGPVDLTELMVRSGGGVTLDALNNGPGLDWVIVGGESGPGARPCALEWIESIVQQCAASSTAAFVKQLGAYVVSEQRTATKDMMREPAKLKPQHFAPNGEVWAWRMGTEDRKGGDISEFPADIQVREWPAVRT